MKATKINLFSFKAPHMRTFHITWFAFFLCFFGWFGIAPLMAYVREEFKLTKDQIGNIIIASVAITIVARLLVGWFCDKFGPRLTYSWLLLISAIPVTFIGFSQSYESFLIFRLAIGVIGASFVITQYHTSVMFAPNVVGTANATTAGWGNLGGGVTNMVMPLIFGLFAGIGLLSPAAWRWSMVVPGIALFLMGFIYLRFTQDTPEGNFSDLKKANKFEVVKKKKTKGSFIAALTDYRVIALFVIYAACFGIELTINNVAALYFKDDFNLTPEVAGLIAGLFGLMNLFARSLGGIFSDRFNKNGGLKGRVIFMGIALFGEGIMLMVFSQMAILPLSIVFLILFSLFVQMSEGATFGVVPFINKKAIGAVSGIVGAGGNVGAVAAGFLFKGGFSYTEAFLILGIAVSISAGLSLLVRFSKVAEEEVRRETIANFDSEPVLAHESSLKPQEALESI